MANRKSRGNPVGAGAPVPSGAAGRVAEAATIGQPYYVAGAALCCLVSLVLYLKTMGPSSAFWDAGEFIATSYTLGIPHSPGTPLYVLVGRVFTLLPLPLTIAGRVNFMSVLFGAMGVLFVYMLGVRFLDYMLGRSASLIDTLIKVAGALVGALFLAFSDSYWTNATEAEVYAISAFFMGFMTWLVLRWADNPNGARATSFIYLLFYLLALSVGLHLGTILVSGIVLLVLMTRSKSFSNMEFLLVCFGMAVFVADATLYRAGNVTVGLLVLFALGLFFLYNQTKSPFALICTVLFVLGISIHLYLMIRSGHNPSIDEGDPETWRGLYAALRREQYPPPNILVRKADFGFQLQHFNDYFQSQFRMVSAYWGKLSVGSIIPLALGIWGMVDQYSKNRKSFIMLFVTFVVVSLGMIIYLNFSDTEVRERAYFYSPAFYYFAVYIALGVGSLLSEIRRFAVRKRLNQRTFVLVPSIILIALPLMTARHHYFAHDRSKNVVCREYAKNMLVALEPNALIFTNGDNDTFPLWYIQEVEKYRTDIRVVNLSLLNTPWYIKQLRDNEPKVNILWEDAQVDGLRPVRTQDGVLYIRDLGVQHILKYNSRERPIYFAVTIPPNIFAPYREFLEMEGLVYRAVPRRGTNMINKELLEESIWSKYSYRGLLTEDFKRDHSIYQRPFVNRLVQNYAAAFAQLGYLYFREKDCESALKNMDVARQISPDLDQLIMTLGWYYLECGDTTGAIDHYRTEFERRPDRTELLYRLAGVYERIGKLDKSLETLDELIRHDPNHRDAVMSAATIAVSFRLIDRAKAYLSNWVATHPDDVKMRTALKDLMDRAEQDRDSSQNGR